MLRGIGSRFYGEAGFLILVAVVLAVQRVGPGEIVVTMLVAYLAIFSIEVLLARRRAGAAKPPAVVPDATPGPELEPEEDVPSAIVAMRSVEPDEPVVVPVVGEAEADDELEADVEVELEEADEVPPTEWVDDAPRPPVVVSEPNAEPEPAPESPVLIVVPEPEPEPEPEPVVMASFPQEPRAWNLWELERLVRTRAGRDPLRDEEWGYLLVYLRDFASSDGVLPEDFDALVRESFGELLEAAAAR